MGQSSVHQLRMVRNVAARLLLGAGRWDYITPVLASLHWLSVTYRMQFEILFNVFKCLNGTFQSF